MSKKSTEQATLGDYERALIQRFVKEAGRDASVQRSHRKIAAHLLQVSPQAIAAVLRAPAKRGRRSANEEGFSEKHKDLIRTFVEHGADDEEKSELRKTAEEFFGLTTAQVSAITAWTKIWAQKAVERRARARRTS